MKDILNDTNIIYEEIKEKLDKCLRIAEANGRLIEDIKKLKNAEDDIPQKLY